MRLVLWLAVKEVNICKLQGNGNEVNIKGNVLDD